ncbi:hypothetical protein C475_02688 [Halosimplex carlsbadense 2-9-1]|uniref:Uncharacterized protein n=1 Tax=Halosimplex carlsbadense 2-9-1 TaxID=797114 RepID=M0D267_9EURY|nr:hypothetical protein [Halosimplex carlsbadense]ELZ29520.1 hypothetical protein C475_02688 [Halosimplex carlsbadense 2-9-1]
MGEPGGRLARADAFLWHLSNVGVGVAVLVTTLLYAPPGRHSLELVALGIDPFYPLVSLSVAYTCWTGIDFWNWYSGTDDR